MKKLFASILAVVFCFGIGVNAQTNDVSFERVAAVTTMETTVKNKNLGDLSRPSGISTADEKCTTAANGIKYCTDGQGYTRAILKNGALYTETWESSSYKLVVYYETAVVSSNPYVTGLIYTEKYSNGKPSYQQTIVVKKKTYTYAFVGDFDYLSDFSKFSKVTEVEYSAAGKKTVETVYIQNAKGYITTIFTKEFYPNGLVKTYTKGLVNTSGNVYRIYFKKYYTNKKVGEYTVAYISAYNKVTKQTTKTYDSKGKKKLFYTLSATVKGVTKNETNTIFSAKGYKAKHKVAGYKNGKWVKMTEYRYNKKGQLKSNKYGNAYRYTFHIKSESIVYKTYKAKYSKKGKLGANKKVKNQDISFYTQK